MTQFVLMYGRKAKISNTPVLLKDFLVDNPISAISSGKDYVKHYEMITIPCDSSTCRYASPDCAVMLVQ